MKKVFAVLLLISAVIGMAVPVMATAPSSSVSSDIDVDVAGTNWAVNKIKQTQEMNGDQTNGAIVEVLGGDADASSGADADGSASNSGDAEVEDDDRNAALAGNLLSGNGIATSGAEAIAGDATNNGDVIQVNAVVQFATADIENKQIMKQKVIVPVDINTSVTEDETITETTTETTSEIEDSIVDNHVHDSALEVEEE